MHACRSTLEDPTPVLKYQLLPEVRELSAGNPVQWYLRSFAEQRNFFFNRESVAARARYRAMPLTELPVNDLRNYGGSALTQADYGARLDTPDWAVLERVKSEDMDLTMPELQPLWVLATALQVRFRGEVADGRFDDAIRTAKTLFALARHLGECPASAANRLGIAVAGLTLDTLEEMAQQPGCPNLYWALTDLPCPLVDLRKGVQADRVKVAAELRGLHTDAPMTERELDEWIGRLSGRLGLVREQAGRSPRGLRAALAERMKDPARIAAARARVLDSTTAAGWFRKAAALRVLSFPDQQLILLDELRGYEERRDEETKLLALAPWQFDVVRGKEPSRGDGLFADLLPGVIEARRSQAKLEQRIGLLRHVEALRMYAAGHGGKLPEKLSDIAVPLPTDPFTGKPFGYALDDETARISGGRGYEVVIRK